MRITRLSLEHVRVFQEAEFTFQQGFNLLAGINGAGKSTVLDVLCIMIAQNLSKYTASRRQQYPVSEMDITVGHDKLAIEMDFFLHTSNFTQRLVKYADDYVVDEEVEEKAASTIKPNSRTIWNEVNSYQPKPIVAYFSTSRALTDMTSPTKTTSEGTEAAAYDDALKSRQLRLREFAQWWIAQKSQLDETGDEKFARRLNVMETAIERFLDGYHNLVAETIIERNNQTETLFVEKDGNKLDVRQLSDGERGTLAIVLDIARRMALANPDLDDPLANSIGVILIDEIGLHLHPTWQRQIVNALENTFPKCQFIATTHSPQILSEVEPEKIIVIDNGQTMPPQYGQSFGMDSNWILKHLMGAEERPTEVTDLIQAIEDAIDNEEYDTARSLLEQLKQIRRGESAESVEFEVQLDMIEFLDDDEEDN